MQSVSDHHQLPMAWVRRVTCRVIAKNNVKPSIDNGMHALTDTNQNHFHIR